MIPQIISQMFNLQLQRGWECKVMEEIRRMFETLFNPAVEKSPEHIAPSGGICVRLTEDAVSNSYACVCGKMFRAYHIDKWYEQLPLFNPSKVLGLRCKHDYLLVRQNDGIIELYFVEMKSGKDTFEHIRHQLQGGIALLAYIQRLCMDRLGMKWPIGAIRFYAVALFHTKKMPETTSLSRVADIIKERALERERYKDVKGVYCVQNNRLELSEMRNHCAEVSYCMCIPNAFTDFPSEVAE